MQADSGEGTVAHPGSRGAAWLTLLVLLLFSIAAPLNQFKVPPIMPVLMDALGLSVSGAGLLMSVYAATGLVLALPAGLIYQKAGARVTGLLAGGATVLGAALGALSRSTNALLVSRVIEGMGTSFVAVLAPSIIARWFEERQRGTALGIWNVWVPVGATAMLILAPPLAGWAGWRAVWWLGAGYALAVTVLYLALVRPAPRIGSIEPITAPVGRAVTSGQVLRNHSLWLLAASFGAFCAAATAGSTYLPTFLTLQRGLSLAQAALLSGIGTVIGIFAGPAGGVVSDRIGSRKKPFVGGLALAVILLPLVGAVSVAGVIVVVILQGLVFGMIPPNIFAAAVEAVSDERQGGTAMAILMVGQNAGMLVGPLIFGALVEGPGWPAAFASLAILAVAALLAGSLAKVR
jgi:MFS family permease